MIDVHTHLFNLHYMPVSGIMQSYGVPEWLADAVAHILENLTGRDADFGPGFENNPLLGSPAADNWFLKSQSEIIDTLVQKVSPEDVAAPEVQRALAELETEKGENELPLQTLLFELQHEKAAFHDWTAFADRTDLSTKLRRLFEKAFSKMDEGANWLRWFAFMTRSEKRIYQALLQDNPGINTFVHHMMDVDHYFPDNPPRFNFVDVQIQRMKELHDQSEGRLIGFVAFDPSRADGLQVVRTAIEAGFKGVKFYPPLGYKPIGNADSVVDERNKALFRYCIENDLPVFTHCTPGGFEARPHQTGLLADPKYWKILLEIPEFNKLRVCFGHAGGVNGWFESNDAAGDAIFNQSYGSVVYELCTTYPNVYCEVGFLDYIYNAEQAASFQRRLVKLLNAPATYPFGSKIMYGSDWHMLFYEDINATYLKKYEALFNQPDLQRFREDFFKGNAERYLRVGEG